MMAFTQQDEGEWDFFAETRVFAQSIVDTVREPMIVLDGDLRVHTANRSFYKTFQVNPEETAGRLVYELGNGQWDIPALRELLEKLLPQKNTFDDFEVRHAFPSIGYKAMLLNARRLRRGGDQKELILLAIEDITERQQAEETRLEIETRYTSLVRNIKDHSIFMTDAKGNITSWNEEAKRIFGHSEEEILGRHFSIIFSAEDIEHGVPELELRTAQEAGRAEDERWHVRKDGSRFWALGIVTPRHDGRGNLEGFSKILRDMTERKLAQEQLQEYAHALQQAARRKDEFLAMLAHELRNPLAPIRSGIDVLQILPPNGDQAKQILGMMGEQAHNLVRLIDDLLDVSRCGRGKLELRRQQAALQKIITNAIQTAEPLVRAGSHELSVMQAKEKLYVHGDPTRLCQIVANLLNNAAKYTPKGGKISLTTERIGDEVAIRVRDNGVGIAAEVMPSIFRMFVQADSSLHRSQGGLGIGLTLVKNLVEMHGGTVEAISDGMGKGSEFIVRLPILDASEVVGEEAAGSPDVTRSFQSHKILVVDDLRPAALIVATLLRSFGQNVRTAESGAEALAMMEQEKPDLVLSDISMPEMNGYELAQKIRQRPEWNDICLVAVTGYGQESDRKEAVDAGFNSHVVKPISRSDLERLLASLAYLK